MQSASAPSPTGSAAGNPHDEKKHGLFHILALLRNLFGCSYGFDVSFEPLREVLGKQLEHRFRRTGFRIGVEGVVIGFSIRVFNVNWWITELHKLQVHQKAPRSPVSVDEGMDGLKT